MNSLPIDIIYGTVTGNAQDLAEKLSDRCDQISIPCTLTAAEDWDNERFKQPNRRTVLIFSTWGDGEPPDDAIEFCENIYDKKVDVHQLQYVVVALGDSAYDDFCGCGRRLDESLSAAGATKIMDRVELDVDFDDDFDAWMENFLNGATAPC
ncbi:MAG: flavodoxin domain-containing protein [Verrucomicrobiota bacterium]